MKAVSKRVEGLSPNKRALLARRLASRLATRSRRHIPRRQATDATPLSFAQERLRFLDRLLPGNPMNNMAGAARIVGRAVIGGFIAALALTLLVIVMFALMFYVRSVQREAKL